MLLVASLQRIDFWNIYKKTREPEGQEALTWSPK